MKFSKCFGGGLHVIYKRLSWQKKKNEELNEIKNLNFIISEDTLWRNVFTQCVFEV